jgi:nicotinate-nucleotide adenylyltransferase
MRVGCLGINANPPHLGHIAAAEKFRYSGFVDRVWLIPSFEHPFGKADVAAWEHRVNMCRLIENPNIAIHTSLVEAEMGETDEYKFQKSFTVYVLEHLRRTRPAHQFFWCVCSDILTSGSYKQWYHWEDLEREEKILVAERAGHPLPQGPLPKPFVRVNNTYQDISSTKIRAMLRGGMDVKKYTGDKVAEYIRKHKLYTKGG